MCKEAVLTIPLGKKFSILDVAELFDQCCFSAQYLPKQWQSINWQSSLCLLYWKHMIVFVVSVFSESNCIRNMFNWYYFGLVHVCYKNRESVVGVCLWILADRSVCGNEEY